MQHWGNLSPYYSVSSHGLPETSSLFPDHCELEEVHWLQRHGARYPTSSAGGPGDLGARLKKAEGWKATGEMRFLNDWEYRLGAEVLTPFGRQQLCKWGGSSWNIQVPGMSRIRKPLSGEVVKFRRPMVW
jgi:hypothetical protein